MLALGQLMNICVGSANHILAVTGHERSLAAAIGISLVLNIILCLILIPAYGVFGAGIAVAISIAVSNTTQLLLIRGHLGIWSLPFRVISKWFVGSLSYFSKTS